MAVARAERPPQGHVATLVVPDAGLRPDVAEYDVDLPADRRGDLISGHRLEEDGAPIGVDGERGGDRGRVSAVLHAGDDGGGVSAGGAAPRTAAGAARRA